MPVPHFPLLRSLGGGHAPISFEKAKELTKMRIGRGEYPHRNIATKCLIDQEMQRKLTILRRFFQDSVKLVDVGSLNLPRTVIYGKFLFVPTIHIYACSG